jgi:agmatine deiminase
MKNFKLLPILTLLFLSLNTISFSQITIYTMPEETAEHEGTWLQWPHSYTYGTLYRNRLDQTWVDMTENLIGSENVHIVAYNNTEKIRIMNLLTVSTSSLDSEL